jgi:hypothetical protein
MVLTLRFFNLQFRHALRIAASLDFSFDLPEWGEEFFRLDLEKFPFCKAGRLARRPLLSLLVLEASGSPVERRSCWA